jgi:hypothetical protein
MMSGSEVFHDVLPLKNINGARLDAAWQQQADIASEPPHHQIMGVDHLLVTPNRTKSPEEHKENIGFITRKRCRRIEP